MSFFTIGAKDRIKKDHYLIHLDKRIDWKPIENALRGMHLNETKSKGGPKAYNNLSIVTLGLKKHYAYVWIL